MMTRDQFWAERERLLKQATSPVEKQKALIAHRRSYNRQYFDMDYVRLIASRIGHRQLRAISRAGQGMTEIPYAVWDNLPDPPQFRDRLTANGDHWSLTVHTHVAQEAARVWIEQDRLETGGTATQR